MLGQGPPFPKAAFAAYQARHPPPAGVINPYTTMASGGEIPKKAMKSHSSPPRPPPRSVPAPPARPPPRPRTSGNLQEPEGRPDSSRKLNMAVGGTVSEGILLRRPYNHCMAGMTAFEHGMGHYKGMSHSVRYNPTNQNFAQASFVQGGYFPMADHRLI